jgi:elongation factor G
MYESSLIHWFPPLILGGLKRSKIKSLILFYLEENMKKYEAGNIRNVVLTGHGTVGKTSLNEAMLSNCKMTDRLGKIIEGNTVSDFREDEINRKISINLSLSYCEYKETKINIIDTPGYADFAGEVMSGMKAAEAAIVVVDAVTGCDVGTTKVWKYADDNNLPRIIFVNRMDKENSSLEKVMASLNSKLESNFVLVQLPIGIAGTFKGVIDLLKMNDVPAEMKTQADEYHDKLIEAIASLDEKMIEEYLEGKELTREEIIQGLQKGIAERTLIPVLVGSATNNIGVNQLLDFSVDYLPSPAKNPQIKPSDPVSLLIFKTHIEPHMGEISYLKIYSGSVAAGVDLLNGNKRANERLGQVSVVMGKNRKDVESLVAGDIGAAVKLKSSGTNDTLCDAKHPVTIEPIKFPDTLSSMAVFGKSKDEVEKIGNAIHILMREDPTLKFALNPETHENILSGIGSLQLEVLSSRVKSRYGVAMELKKPKVPYRETIRTKVEVQGKHKKQSGGHGQYGDVWIKAEPMERSKGFEFINKVVGGAIPKNYIPAVEKGVKETMDMGILAGYPVVDLRVTLFDGSYHDVDSSDMAFKIAGSLAIHKAVEDARPYLLEPIMSAEIYTPEEYMGVIMGDLNSRRGRVLGMDKAGHESVIKALVPLSEMHEYATTLRSFTHGAGTFKMIFDHYDELPSQLAMPLIETYKKHREEGIK